MLFAKEALGVSLWGRQAEICADIVKHSRVAVRSGHKIGKSRIAAVIALWYALCFPGSRVVMTSASGRQVRMILWHELKALYRGAPLPLGGVCHDDPSTGLKLSHGSEILGFSTDQPERMAGVSGAHLLFIVDEASGVPEPIFEAIEGNRAGGARLLMFSNPTQVSGTFYEAFTSKANFWKGIHVSSTETPNATGKGEIPGLATKQWCDEKLLEWGYDSPLYQVRVLGNFPGQGDANVIALSLVTAAQLRYEDTPAEGPLVAGLDPARFGSDDSLLCLRRGFKPSPLIAWHGLDGVQLADKVVDVLERERKGERVTIKVDVIGIGASVVDALKYHPKAQGWLRVIPINVAERSTVKPKPGEPGYVRLRDQLWFSIKDWLKEGGSLPPDDKLVGELTACKYGLDPQGKLWVESKADLKARLKRSPDRADALALSIFEGLSADVEQALDVFINAALSRPEKPKKKRGEWSTY